MRAKPANIIIFIALIMISHTAVMKLHFFHIKRPACQWELVAICAMKGGKLIKLISINYVSSKEAQMIEKPDPLSVLGKKYTRETARHIPYGGLMNSEGIIIEVITEEQSKTQTKACKEHLIKLLASSD